MIIKFPAIVSDEARVLVQLAEGPDVDLIPRLPYVCELGSAVMTVDELPFLYVMVVLLGVLVTIQVQVPELFDSTDVIGVAPVLDKSNEAPSDNENILDAVPTNPPELDEKSIPEEVPETVILPFVVITKDPPVSVP